MESDDDAALVNAARAGSQAALARLIDRHQQAVRAFLRRVAGSREEADDLAQETFVTAASRLASWRGQASVRAWPCGIAWRKARDARRSLFRARVRDADYAKQMAPEQASGTEGEDRLALAKALAELPVAARAAGTLCLAQDFSHAEAAAVLALPLGTVKSHVSRGRARLLAALKDRS